MIKILKCVYFFYFYSEAPAMPDNVLSLNDLRKLDLGDQIKALLINGE